MWLWPLQLCLTGMTGHVGWRCKGRCTTCSGLSETMVTQLSGSALCSHAALLLQQTLKDSRIHDDCAEN